MKWILIILAVIVVILVVSWLIDSIGPGTGTGTGGGSGAGGYTPRGDISNTPTDTRRSYPVVKPVGTNSQNDWSENSARTSAANKAAADMNKPMSRSSGEEAVKIQRVISSKNISINTSCLNTAQQKINEICRQADKIRSDVVTYRNNPYKLKELYRESVAVSDIAYNLRKEVQTMQSSLNELAKTNSSLKPLCSQVHQLYSALYSNEQELNRRNVTLRTYIGNFGPDEHGWNERIEQRARERRAQGA